MKKSIIITSIIIGVLLAVGGMIYLALNYGNNVKIGYVGSSTGSTYSGSFKYYNGTETKKVKFEKGEEVNLEYEVRLDEGELNIRLMDESGNELLNADNSGDYSFNVEETQKYTITIEAKKAKGNFEISW